MAAYQSTSRIESDGLVSNEGSEVALSWVKLKKHFLFRTHLNILLLFIPLSFMSHWLAWDAALRFSFASLALVPLAMMIGDATEHLSTMFGSTAGVILSVTLANTVEIIVGIVLLLQDELRILQTSMLGSILSNLLFILGCSFFLGGIKHCELIFPETGAQACSSLMTLACIILVIPTAYSRYVTVGTADFVPLYGTSDAAKQEIRLKFGQSLSPFDPHERGVMVLSRGTAIILILVYVTYLVFQLKTHAIYFMSHNTYHEPVSEHPGVSRRPEISSENCEENPRLNGLLIIIVMLVMSTITKFCAEYLVASIEEVADHYHVSKSFIGMILLPIVSKAAEEVTSFRMARDDKTEHCVGSCVGSSIQHAMFVVPLLVIIGWVTGHELTLFFETFEMAVLLVSVILVNHLIMNGKSNYMGGILLISMYFVVALAYWVY